MMREKKMKLMDAVQDALRVKNYAYRTEKTYLQWIRQYRIRSINLRTEID
jgi:hypothetical protein